MKAISTGMSTGVANTEERFEFGKNWGRYVKTVDQDRIASAERSLRQMLDVDTLRGKSFLDVGSGSGLLSLAARRMGARVHSFDFDSASVECTEELRRCYFADDPDWKVARASILDKEYLSTIGTFDVVYAWGVLHHTGAMHRAMGNTVDLVRNRGHLFVAIYNDQGWVSRYWLAVKTLFNANKLVRPVLIAVYCPYFVGLRFLWRQATGRPKLERGMSLWYDMIDWLGGLPFEVARPERIFEFYRGNGFDLVALKTCGGRSGCNEFVFRKSHTE